MRSLVLAMALLFCSGISLSAQSDVMKAFPAAGPGEVRYVWSPPKEDDEGQLKVEIIVGKNAEVDSVNRHFLAGTITEQTIKGWGYNRYVVKSNGQIGGTLMAVPPGQPKVNKFISLRTGPALFRYNSRLPVVVYAPKGFIVRIRVWRPDENVIEGQPG